MCKKCQMLSFRKIYSSTKNCLFAIFYHVLVFIRVNLTCFLFCHKLILISFHCQILSCLLFFSLWQLTKPHRLIKCTYCFFGLVLVSPLPLHPLPPLKLKNKIHPALSLKFHVLYRIPA